MVNINPKVGLGSHGLNNLCRTHWNLNTPMLYEEIVKRREGYIAHLGPVVVRTGSHTGRSPNDKFIVKESTSAEKVWWGSVNRSFDEERFNALFYRLQAYLQGREVYVQDCHAGADSSQVIPPRWRGRNRV